MQYKNSKSLTVLLLAMSGSFSAGAKNCPTNTLAEAQHELKANVDAAYIAELAEPRAPRESPAMKNLLAPAYLPDSTVLVSGATAPEAIALAVENALDSGVSNRTTISMNAFALPSIWRAGESLTAEDYAKTSFWRRVSWSISGGGVGQAFDRDGDGAVDDALKTNSYSDIFTWEVQYRLYGSRDNSDKKNQIAYQRVKAAYFSDQSARLRKVHQAAEKNGVENVEPCIAANTQSAFYSPSAVNEALGDKFQAASDTIQSSAVWTLAFGGTSRKRDFGADSRTVSLRGDINKYSLNASWTQQDSLAGESKPTALKLGVKYSRELPQKLKWIDQAMTLAISGNYERSRNTSMLVDDTNAKLNVGLTVPVTKTIAIPLSITWANKESLLGDARGVTGNLGFTIDTSALRKLGSGN